VERGSDTEAGGGEKHGALLLEGRQAGDDAPAEGLGNLADGSLRAGNVPKEAERGSGGEAGKDEGDVSTPGKLAEGSLNAGRAAKARAVKCGLGKPRKTGKASKSQVAERRATFGKHARTHTYTR
jgi:hypothetical protein